MLDSEQISSADREVWEAVIGQVDAEQVVELARGALRIPSYSGEEIEAAKYFERAMADAGLDTALQPVPESPLMGPSANAIGRLEGLGGGPTLMFNGHIDHNPVCDGWTKDPFGGEVEDGWLYGFVHMKAANATYIAAVDAVRRAGVPLKGDVVLANVCGELRGGAGTQHSLREGLTADYFVLGEPTELTLGFNHTASLVARLHVRGRMKHFATVEVEGSKGVNAVEKAAKLIARLAPSHTPIPPVADGGWLTFEPRRGFEGLPQINVGPIRGGISRSYDEGRPALFPDLCSVTVDFRIVPGMTKDSIRADVERLVAAMDDPDLDVEVEFKADTFPIPFDGPRESPVVDAIVDGHKLVRGAAPEESKVLKFAASDASWMSQAGIPGIIYGPTGRYLSRPDERCETADLVDAAKVYAFTVARLCA